jgi:galactokinase
LIDLTALRRSFRELYDREPRLFRAPGRVNLIGEHTDYNEGFVLPVAIELETVVAAAPRDHRRIRARSVNLNEAFELDLDTPHRPPQGNWRDYVEGMARTLEARGIRLRGADLIIQSDLPLGAGLSSSAALEMSVGLALLSLSGEKIDPLGLALIGQQAEREFVGANCGIMDQAVAMLGRKEHAILIDCRSMETKAIPMSLDETRIVVCDSRVKHSVVDSSYNDRRSECEQAVEQLRRFLPEVRSLRDVDQSQLDRLGDQLSETMIRRCRHVISENARTLAAAAALRSGDLEQVGILMAESQQSLRDNYEVSCPELDLLVKVATGLEGVVASRMTGAGFGGCTVNLVQRNAIESFTINVKREYSRTFGIDPLFYTTGATAGASEINGAILAYG